MKGLTDYLTERSWEDTLIATYVLVAERLPQALRRAEFRRRRGPAPEYDDAQIITMALAADYWFDGDEEKTVHFLRQYHPTLWSNGLPDTSRFNVRRRELWGCLKPYAASCGMRGGHRLGLNQTHRPPRRKALWRSNCGWWIVPRSFSPVGVAVGRPPPLPRKNVRPGLASARAKTSSSLAGASTSVSAWIK